MQLRQELRALSERVTDLETAAMGQHAEEGAGIPSPPIDEFWALNGLEARRTEHPSTVNGMVMLIGSLTLPTGEPVAWQEGASSDALFDGDWSGQAGAFAALGHSVRLELLRQILNGVRTTSELAKVESLGTTGQLHHHLRQLIAAGWLRQSRRGRYEVPPKRVIPLLVSVFAAD